MKKFVVLFAMLFGTSVNGMEPEMNFPINPWPTTVPYTLDNTGRTMRALTSGQPAADPAVPATGQQVLWNFKPWLDISGNHLPQVITTDVLITGFTLWTWLPTDATAPMNGQIFAFRNLGIGGKYDSEFIAAFNGSDIDVPIGSRIGRTVHRKLPDPVLLPAGATIDWSFIMPTGAGFVGLMHFIDLGTVNGVPVSVNSSPNAVSDAVAGTKNVQQTIAAATLLANDSDPDSDPLSLVSVQNASNCTVVIDGNGDVTFTPATDFVGNATFTYTVSDGTLTDTATVTVAVADPAPAAGAGHSDVVFAGTSPAGVTAFFNTGFGALNEAEATVRVTQDKTFDRLYADASVAPGSGQSFTFTLVKNGVPTALTATISGTNKAASDLANSVSFAAGDTYSMKVQPSAGAAASFFNAACRTTN